MKWVRCCALSSLLVVFGCAGGKPPKSPAGAAVTTPGASSRSEAADLSPVAAPPDLFAVGRLRNAANVADTLGAWAKLPVDWRRLLKRAAPGLQSVVMFDAPVNFAAALDVTGPGAVPQPFAVFSVGLSSLDGALRFARQHGDSVREMRPGVYRIDDESMHCALAAAVGRAPARLVCGDRQKDLQALLPYVTRGLPREALSKSDLHVELRFAPFRRHYARQIEQVKTLGVPFVLKELSLDTPDFDRALADAVHGLGDELTDLIHDAGTVDFDMTFAKGKGVIDAALHVKFIGKRSWLVSSMLEAGRRSAPAPDLFWRLPRDATSASFSVGFNPDRTKDTWRTLGELAEGFLAHEKVPRRSRQRLVDAIEQTRTLSGTMVSARGPVASELKPGAKASAVARKRDRIRTSLGWYLFGSHTKTTAYKKLLNGLAGVYRDRQLRHALAHSLGVSSKDLPVLRTRAARLGPGSVVYELDVPARFLSRHSLHEVLGGRIAELGGPIAEIRQHGKAKRKKRAHVAGRPLKLFLILMPAKNGTWLGFSTDEKVLKSQLSIVNKPGAANTLASREGLDELKSAKLVAGGFLSAEGLVEGLESTLGVHQVGHLLDAMPHHGVTPMLLEATVGKQGAGAQEDWSFRVPKASVEDFGSLVPGIAAMVRH